ncbi:MAG: TlpA disulfide reductase family protein [Bacteroidia bacterium]|nr:TlpA family protein disulfide reductase [Bacteroidia bacterium]MDW8157534.1 TlpA disulfide reductase family protein [Bacteroidia bacterium]
MQAQSSLYKLFTFSELEQYLQQYQGKVVVVNFWSTWCRPCIEELPYFERLNEEWKERKVKVILVSVDFLSEIDSRLVPFLQKKQLKSEVVVLNEKDPNEWIDRVNSQWSGAIPATLLVDSAGKRVAFAAKPFTYQELQKFVQPFLQP